MTVMNRRARDYNRFQLLWSHCLVDSAIDESAIIHQQLMDSYSEPQRYYHTLDHIEHCLSLFDNISSKLKSPHALELAIWFHDVIYQPGAANNEQLSADQFMRTTKNRFDDSLRNTVYQHIMATLHLHSEMNHADTQYMVDIDLSSFGLPWPEFIHDSENLRREMAHLSNEDYCRKQSAFQQALMDRPRFFRSDYFYQNYESQARQNLSDYYESIHPK
jgi:predicted metal-dependent HD superfamily phosphohydrolase